MSKYPQVVSRNHNPYQPLEKIDQSLAEDVLIYAYVPEAGQMYHEDALKVARERDLQAAKELADDCIAFAKKQREERILKMLGF